MEKRIPSLVSLGFGVLIALGLCTSFYLHFTLQRRIENYKAVEHLIAAVRANLRDLRSDYLQTREEVAGLLIDPRAGANSDEHLRRREASEAKADEHISAALAATGSEELKKILRQLMRRDRQVAAVLEEEVLNLAGTDEEQARELYSEKYLPAERANMAMVDEALRLAVEEVNALDAKADVDSHQAEDYSRIAIALFFGAGVLGAFYFHRAVARVVRRSEIAAKENREVVDHSSDLICSFDAAGKFLRTNKAGERVLGYSAEELKGRCYTEFLHPDDLHRSEAAASDIVAGHAVMEFENRYFRKTGEVVDLVWSARWSDEQQQMFCLAHDMTERKRAETERQIISDIVQGVITTTNLEELLELAWRSIGKLLYAENCFVAFYDRRTDLLHFEFWMDKFDPLPAPQHVGTV
ncbi:MAG: PAS domain S-box protein [Verrucomicrobiota bacterium]|nr:PAS domain S-box protein [Verrucomicrobiota bacterium]